MLNACSVFLICLFQEQCKGTSVLSYDVHLVSLHTKAIPQLCLVQVSKYILAYKNRKLYWAFNRQITDKTFKECKFKNKSSIVNHIRTTQSKLYTSLWHDTYNVHNPNILNADFPHTL